MSQTYAPGQVAISVGGVPVSGWVSARYGRNSNSATISVSADGSSAAVLSADKSGFLEIEMQQTSLDNSVMSGLLAAQELIGEGFRKTVEFRDLRGTSLIQGFDCLIEKLPDGEFNTEIGTRVWRFVTGNLVATTGGNI